ncbi:small peptidoglycan-associated lipoprotein [Neobacillus piezotolerans]|uniref:Small peptidoglycan-associated lipoprotein n=1 Tax=Neobacillus piezotolerans TaxID=2259171 RepID=A0A3D8GVB9_9BACI|nr:small peptidoglycan-associated lipoprotein [Neobacillus piezotolerans]RDU38423.1 small peptidoglycan-associated lipoprotein [Neobacillus piezotolerans]
MKGFPVYLILFSLFITSSCGKGEQARLSVDKNSKQVIFFSDEKQYKREAAYYDALIELKKDFPDEMENLMVLSSKEEKKYYDEFDIKSGPALIVLYKEKVMVRIHGITTKEKIIQPVSKALDGKNFKMD